VILITALYYSIDLYTLELHSLKIDIYHSLLFIIIQLLQHSAG